jgi:hypothetical protein
MRMIGQLGTRLLETFVPRVEAHASSTFVRHFYCFCRNPWVWQKTCSDNGIACGPCYATRVRC